MGGWERAPADSHPGVWDVDFSQEVAMMVRDNARLHRLRKRARRSELTAWARATERGESAWYARHDRWRALRERIDALFLERCGLGNMIPEVEG